MPELQILRYTLLLGVSNVMSFCSNCGARYRGGCRFCPECGSALFAMSAPHASDWDTPSRVMASAVIPVSYATRPPKRVGLAVLLTILFGPLGLLYCSVSGALYMLLAWCFLVLATCDHWLSSDFLPTLIAWPVCIAWAALATKTFNEDRR